jgi:hypothetical protein
MTTQIFYNETSLNGKFQVMTHTEMTGKGVKKIGSNCITTQKGEVYKNLNNYWVTNSILEQLKKKYNTQRACF